MTGVLLRADDVLRRRPWATRSGNTRSALVHLTLIIFLFGILYGSVMGSFGGLFGERLWQVFYSAVKVPLLLLVTFLIGLPSFFVFNTLLGLRGDFAEATRALVATQAGLAVILASLAPFTGLWYFSSANYPAATLFNATMFAVASFGAQHLLRGYYRPLIERNHRHLWMYRSWIVIYVVIAVQMAWVLRPFLGAPSRPVQFFREGAWGNAYVVVAELIWNLISK